MTVFLQESIGKEEKMKRNASKKDAVDPEARHKNLTLLNRNHTEYPDSPDKAKIETFDNLYPERDYTIEFDCPEFTSLCPVTGQPDFGHIIIRYTADRKCIESKSLKLYLFSFRNHKTFHEEAVNRILSDLAGACHPRRMEVRGEFRPRGGISLIITATETGKNRKNVL